jgi:hypothetical protein
VSNDDEPAWQDQHSVVVSGGVAAVVLLALLVWGVIHTANKSSRPPGPVEFPSSSATSSTYTTTSRSSTSYTIPSAQTSQDNPVVTGPSAPSTTEGAGGTDTETSTTTTNPYVTTTPTNAGHI